MLQQFQIELRDSHQVISTLEFYDFNGRYNEKQLQNFVETFIKEIQKENNGSWTIEGLVEKMGLYGFYPKPIRPDCIIKINIDKFREEK